MNIETIKISNAGYLVNGTLSVPKADGNRDYEAIKEFIANGGTVDSEFTDAELLETAKSSSLLKVTQAFETDVKNMVGNVTLHEIASWRKQEEQARAWLADNTVSTPTVDGLLVTRALGETKAELVAKIIANADAYEMAYAPLLGKFQALSRQIDAVFISVTAGDGGHATVADALTAVEAPTW